ncbi:UNVERIFIED_CONTAM: Potassium/sodium hyperpolarization-activated cyclic nucleotide-gated channel 2 [Siphonaria sp. JEL0065]|nr:Potassium/sodium hyperpolarization-activated cyclic nucleotide-gated channel 2 [Siphonaria sp. JEL0065]
MFPLALIPNSMIEQIGAVVFIILAAILYAIFIGSVSSAVMSVNPAGRLYSEKIDELKDYIKWKDLKKETQSKLFEYYETKYRGKYFEENSLLADMNESLKAEICLHNTRDLILKVPFLKRNVGDGRDDLFIGRIATALQPKHYIPGDYVTKQGDVGNDMFFILSGKVDVFVNGNKVVSLDDGAYLGEVALITGGLRTASVMAAAPSELYRLTQADFKRILDEFLDMKMNIEKLASDRQQVIKNMAKRDENNPVVFSAEDKEKAEKVLMKWRKAKKTSK